jgi:opacity protein-like surface antigen
MNREREKWDELENLFRRKLQNLEVETSPDYWDTIASRLSERETVPLHRRWTYWAAAVLATLIIGGGSVYLLLHINTDTMITKQIVPDIRHKVSPIPSTIIPVMPESSAVNQNLIAIVSTQKLQQPIANVSIVSEEETETTKIMQDVPTVEDNSEIGGDFQEDMSAIDLTPQQVGAFPSIQTKNLPATTRKWSFGMGMGGLTQNSGKVVNTYLRSSNMEDEELLAINAVSDQNLGKQPKTNIKHKTPISFGLSVSRTLGNRFSLQTGLTYSFLVSDWETLATAYNNKIKQTLHFVGVPIYLSYEIAEWNRFKIYASAGAQTQFNVAGRLTVKRFSDELQTSESHINQRMKELQWSTSAHAGVSYPLFPYVSIFAEIGATYYFNNGSEIKTIYSDKAFNINPQIGLRLNF